jgi:hypothetical protein
MLAAPLSAAEPSVDSSSTSSSDATTSAAGNNAAMPAGANSSGTSSSASTDGSSNKSTNDGIPDELKDVLPKEDAPAQSDIIMGPDAGSHALVPTSGSPGHSDSTAVQSPSSAAVQPPSASPAGGRPPVQASGSSTPSSASPATQSSSQSTTQKKAPESQVLLKGRLEEIGGSGAKLPVGVMLNLKTQTAHMDPGVEKQLAGKVASFPSDWQGSYGGTITIYSAQFDPAAYQFDQEATIEEQKIEAPGTQGSTSFNFFRQNNIIALQPATIMLPPRNDSPVSRQMQAQLRNSPMGQMLGGNGGAMLSMLTTTQPMMVLGDLSGATGVTGNALQNVVVKNDIRQLKQGVLEENLIVQESERHHETGQVKRTYSETVLRFTRLNPRQLYVQAASIKYRHDGHFLSKVIMFGTMTRGVSGGAYPMGGFPGGAFPGVNPSGAGGFGQLNDMLKQLQGF